MSNESLYFQYIDCCRCGLCELSHSEDSGACRSPNLNRELCGFIQLELPFARLRRLLINTIKEIASSSECPLLHKSNGGSKIDAEERENVEPGKPGSRGCIAQHAENLILISAFQMLTW